MPVRSRILVPKVRASRPRPLGSDRSRRTTTRTSASSSRYTMLCTLLQVARGTRRASRILGLRSLIGLRLALRVANDRSESRTILTALPTRIPGSLETLALGIRLVAVRPRDRGEEQSESRSPVDGEAPDVLEHRAHPRLDRLLLDPSAPLEDVRDASMSSTEWDRGLGFSRELEIGALQSEGGVGSCPAPDDWTLDDGRGHRDRIACVLNLDRSHRCLGVPGQAEDDRQPPRRPAFLRRLHREFVADLLVGRHQEDRAGAQDRVLSGRVLVMDLAVED